MLWQDTNKILSVLSWAYVTKGLDQGEIHKLAPGLKKIIGVRPNQSRVSWMTTLIQITNLIGQYAGKKKIYSDAYVFFSIMIQR